MLQPGDRYARRIAAHSDDGPSGSVSEILVSHVNRLCARRQAAHPFNVVVQALLLSA
jgi:hypothetical protein